MKRLICILTVVAAAGTAPLLHAGSAITNTAIYRPDKSAYVFCRGEISLPSDGAWDVSVATSGTEVVQLYVVPPAKVAEIQAGRRMLAVENERQVRAGQYMVSQLYWPCREYAKQHDQAGPASLADLDPKKYSYVLEYVRRSPYRDEGNAVDGPFVFLVPGAKFDATPENEIPDSRNKQVLAVELRPYVDDGKHWVTFTDGSSSRESIDPELVRKHNLTIRPVTTRQNGQAADPLPGELTYRIVAVRPQGATTPVPLIFRCSPSGARVNVAWSLADARADEKAVLTDLKAGRAGAWLPYVTASDSIVMNTWLGALDDRGAGGGRNRGPTTSLFGLFGGRAAMMETFQLQGVGAAADNPAQRTIPLNTIKGVEVKSHPYEEMLKGEKGGELALADCVPCDRVLVYVAKPEALLPFLDGGADFLSGLGGTLTGSGVDYDLKAKYTTRLGLPPDWLKLFLKPELVREVALVFPDLFFIDGTDVTVVSRLAKPKLVQDLLKLAGVADLAGDKIVTRDLGDGRSAFWALRGDSLVTSTSRSELEAVLALQKNGGTNSLGRSAEFRYMLTQLPARATTRMYAYFSDPFIRRQVGPAVKIGQLRRSAARARMEQIAGAALLARMDGLPAPDSVQALATNRYLRGADGFVAGDYAIGTNLIVSSKTYGPLPAMKTLAEAPVDMVTPDEAAAYKAYVDNYSRYWRRYFDPIAIRLDDAPGDALEATTFILPLLDNTAYNGLKEVLLTREDGVPLKAPGLAPEPVVMLSLNLRDASWSKVAEGLSEIFSRYGGVSPAVLDDFGPGLHLAIHDADPVIALGSGDMLGALNANLLGVGRGGEMMFIPVALSILTRPCTLMIETRNPERTRQYLRQTAGSRPRTPVGRGGEVDVDFSQVAGQDSWICTLDLFGMLKLRYGIEVQGRYVMIRNIPWSNKDRVARTDTSPLNGACLQAYPAACELQLAGLFSAAQDQALASALRGLGLLYPLVASGSAAPETAAAEHARLFGFKPVHPGDGKWTWDDFDLASSQYGSVHRHKQPVFARDKPTFGLFTGVDNLCVSLQFEDTGLRTVVRWKAK